MKKFAVVLLIFCIIVITVLTVGYNYYTHVNSEMLDITNRLSEGSDPYIFLYGGEKELNDLLDRVEELHNTRLFNEFNETTYEMIKSAQQVNQYYNLMSDKFYAYQYKDAYTFCTYIMDNINKYKTASAIQWGAFNATSLYGSKKDIRDTVSKVLSDIVSNTWWVENCKKVIDLDKTTEKNNF